MGVNYYTQSNNNHYYGASFGKELDLRTELHELFYGSSAMLPHAKKVMYRRLTGERCRCWDSLHKESDARCPDCHGEPYLFTEEIIDAMSQSSISQFGKQNATFDYNIQKLPNFSEVYYVRDTITPKLGDSIITISLEKNGQIIYPLVRLYTYRIMYLEDLRSDFGRTEYYRLATRQEPL